MTTSRREVLLQGAVIGAGVIAANMTGMEAWAQGAPTAPKLRRSLHGMALNDPILQAWRDGVRLLKARQRRYQLGQFCCHPWQRRRLQSVSARQLVFPALASCLYPHV